jgi:hypothetical protein
MKTDEIKLVDRNTGANLDHNEVVYLSNDVAKKYPLRRIVRYCLQLTAKTLSIDCAGMEGEGDFGIDAFWNYFNDGFSELTTELSGDSEFETILIERFGL